MIEQPPGMISDKPPRRLALSDQLRLLAERLGERSITLGDLSQVFQGRAANLLLIMLAVPFLSPVPLPLLSTPFGLLIAFSGLCMALRRRTWMPERLAKRELPAGAMTRILAATSRFVAWCERLARPRWIYPVHLRIFRRATGSLIAVAGVLLSLPLPVPFSNAFPAAAVVLLALGGLQRDGLFFLAGSAALAVAFSYFIGIGFAGAQLLSAVVS